MKTKRVLVTGSSGYLGEKLVKALADTKSVDRIVGVDINAPELDHPKLRFCKRDVRDPMNDIFEDERIDTVFHLCWIVTPLHNKLLMEDINMRGTKNILDAAVKSDVSYLLYTSSATAYGFYPDNDYPLVEESPLRGNDDLTYSKNKKEIEEVMEEFSAKNPKIKVATLRPCFVSGPGFKNPLATHLMRRFVILPGKSAPFQFVHEDDLINIMVLLFEREIGGIYNVNGEGTITFDEMVKMLGNIAVHIPPRLLYILNNISWYLRLTFFSEFPSSALNLMLYPWVVTSKKLIKNTGYKFEHDTVTAFEDFVRYVKGSRGKQDR